MLRAVPLLLTVSLLFAQQVDPPKKVASVHGVVKDAFSGEPIADCDISITPAWEVAGPGLAIFGHTAMTHTDEVGKYTLANLQAGPLQVFAGLKSGPKVSKHLNLNAGDDLTLDFAIPGSPTVSGRVLNGDGEPIVDAFVYLIQTDYQNGALRRKAIGPKVSNSQGEFAFDKDLEVDRAYYLLVARDVPNAEEIETSPEKREPIEAPTYFGDATMVDAATPIVLRSGEKRQHCDIKIQKRQPYCMEGKVLIGGKGAASQIGIQQAELRGADLVRVRIDPAANGVFHVCGLTPGGYSAGLERTPQYGVAEFSISESDVRGILLNADSASIHLQTKWDGDPPDDSVKTELPSGLASGITIRAAPDLTSQIGNSTGQDSESEYERGRRAATTSFVNGDSLLHALALPGGKEITVQVIANAVAPVTVKMEKAPFDGSFGPPLPAGDYVIATRVPPGSYVKEISYNGVAITDRRLHLAAGTSGTLQVVAAQGAGQVRCHVTDADGNPIAEATVVVVPQGATTASLLNTLAQSQQTDTDGDASIAQLAPGKYKALALTRPYRQIPEDLDKLALALFDAQEVEVEPRGNVPVKLHPRTIW